MATATSLDRVPPQSLEAEQATLGAMMLEREAIARVVETLRASDFYRDVHRQLYQAICDLFERGEPVDLVTLTEHLRSQGQLEAMGGIPYLTNLLNVLPTAANVERYAKIVRDKAVLRDMIRAATEATDRCYQSPDDVESLVDECEQLVFSAGERTVVAAFAPLKELLNQSFDRLEDLRSSHSPGVGLPTGYADLDQLTAGLQPADLAILAARPSMGKTALALGIATNVAREMPVAFFSLEMAKESLAQRILSSEARISLAKLRQGHIEDAEEERIVRVIDSLYGLPLFVDDSALLTVLQIKGKCRRLQAEQGGLGLVVIDYMQLIHGHGRFENRQQEISAIARSLKAMARELRVPILALSQLSRQVEMRSPKRPQLSDLRESGSIEAEADLVAMIYRPGAYQGDEELVRAGYSPADRNLTELHVAKQRNGPTGTVKLYWHGEFVRFDTLGEFDFEEYQ